MPSRNFNLQRRFGLKGTHPDPDAIKALRRIWNAKKGDVATPANTEGEGNTPAPATTTPMPPPAGDKPVNS